MVDFYVIRIKLKKMTIDDVPKIWRSKVEEKLKAFEQEAYMEEKYIKIITENTESCKSAHKRLDTLEKNIDGINNLAVAVKEIAMETKATREDVNDMNSRLKNVENKPAKNWENLSKTILTRNCNSSSGLFFGKIWNVGGIKKWIVISL